MEAIYKSLLTSDLITMTKPKNSNKLISYGNHFDFKLVYSLAWIYKYYFEERVIVYLPRIVDIEATLAEFNKDLNDFVLTQDDVIYCNLETIELKYKNKVVIYGFADFIFNELVILNRRRITTHLKNSKCENIHIISYSNLKCLNIPVLDNYIYLKLDNPTDFEFTFIDILEESDQETLIDFIIENQEKRIYLALCIPVRKILELEQSLKTHNLTVVRRENQEQGPLVVINSLKTIEKSFLKSSYDIYIFITRKFEYPLEILHYLKEVNRNCEVYFDGSMLTNVNESLKKINCEESNERTNIKDSREFSTYNEMLKELKSSSFTNVTEAYYKFDAPDSISLFDLTSLTKREYDAIRNFVKVKLMNKLNMDDVKTCQLSTPCSPRDRSKKLNSLSNKISSSDYRCNVTCEIFRDYTIGVVLWNETFANRKSLYTWFIKQLKDEIYIYQTTSGTWKYTTVN